MEYYKDLLRKNKNSKAQIILGTVLIILSIFWIIINYKDNSIRLFDWLYSIIFLLNGAINILEGSGISSNKIFGKAYIKINSVFIDFKPTIFEKSQKIDWDDMVKISLKPTKIAMKATTGKHLVISYSILDYNTVSEIKEKIRFIAENKNIKIN
jgi:hypothetical protein